MGHLGPNPWTPRMEPLGPKERIYRPPEPELGTSRTGPFHVKQCQMCQECKIWRLIFKNILGEALDLPFFAATLDGSVNVWTLSTRHWDCKKQTLRTQESYLWTQMIRTVGRKDWSLIRPLYVAALAVAPVPVIPHYLNTISRERSTREGRARPTSMPKI